MFHVGCPSSVPPASCGRRRTRRSKSSASQTCHCEQLRAFIMPSTELVGKLPPCTYRGIPDAPTVVVRQVRPRKPYVNVTDSMTFSSASLSHSPATNLIGQARVSVHRRRVVPPRHDPPEAQAFPRYLFRQRAARFDPMPPAKVVHPAGVVSSVDQAWWLRKRSRGLRRRVSTHSQGESTLDSNLGA